MIHEPIEKQTADVYFNSNGLVAKILYGDDCDVVPYGYGDFGSKTNPIPVNGVVGEIKYLAKLRGLTGEPVFFHRINSIKAIGANVRIDMYEILCIDGTQPTIIYFDMYHPRRSNLAPEGFTLEPYNEELGEDSAFGLGSNSYLEDFPFSILKALWKAFK